MQTGFVNPVRVLLFKTTLTCSGQMKASCKTFHHTYDLHGGAMPFITRGGHRGDFSSELLKHSVSGNTSTLVTSEQSFGLNVVILNSL